MEIGRGLGVLAVSSTLVLGRSLVGDFPGDEDLSVLATDVAIVAAPFAFRIVAGVFRVLRRIEEDEWGFGLLGERVDSADGRSINLTLGGSFVAALSENLRGDVNKRTLIGGVTRVRFRRRPHLLNHDNLSDRQMSEPQRLR